MVRVVSLVKVVSLVRAVSLVSLVRGVSLVIVFRVVSFVQGQVRSANRTNSPCLLVETLTLYYPTDT